MIYSTTYVTLPDGTGHAGPRGQDPDLCAGARPRRAADLPRRSTTGCSPSIRCSSTSASSRVLLFVLFKGSTQMGAQRWIVDRARSTCSPPSSRRMVVALILAMFFGENRRGARNTSDLVIGGMFTLVPLLLIAKQPDLGTAVTLLPVFFGVAYLAGLRMRLLAVIALAGLLLAPIVWKFALQDYQKSRIQTFIDPSKDPQRRRLPDDPGADHRRLRRPDGQGIHARARRGSTSSCPVAHNDFIFSVLAEEQGFVGVLVVLGLYLFVIIRSLEAARLAKDRLGAYLVGGIIAGFAFQVIYNVAMSVGLAPVKGITLPLMSYGGSSLIATMATFGLILNVRMRRFTN